MNNIQKPQKTKSFSLIWLLPIIIIIFVGWSEYQTFINQKNKIILLANDANGIKENITPLEYKGVKIGKVTKIKLDKQHHLAKIILTLNKENMDLASKKGNIFWVEKPRVSINQISGLSTILSGYKIKLKPNFDSNITQYKFKLSDNPPMNGYFITLKTKQNVSLNTPILYKELKIGEIIDKKFNNGFILTAVIYTESKKFINNSSIFIREPILKINSKGINVKINSLSSILLGGIKVITPKKEKLTKKEFIIYKNKDEILPKIAINLIIKHQYNLKNNSPIFYQGIKIGEIKNIILKNKKLIAKSYIYKKYDYLLGDKTLFLIQKPKVSINGVKNLKNIIFGNFISIIPNSSKLTKNTFIVYQNKINKSNSIILYLYTKNLDSLTKNSKIYYKNISIGKILNYTFTKNFKNIKVTIAINNKYKPLLNNNSMFYDISSELIAFKNLHLKINFNGLNPLLNGGIALVTNPNYHKLNKKNFKLYNSYQKIEEIKKLKFKGFIKKAYFNNNFKLYKNMNIEYKNQTIGFIKNIKFIDKNISQATLFIYNKYKNLINNYSTFYKNPAIKFQANLNGINLSIDNLTSLLKGSIVLYDTNHLYKNLKIFKDLNTIKQQNSITIIFDNANNVKIGSKILYKGVSIGKVINVQLTQNKVKIQALLNNYKSFAKKGTIFYLQKPIVSIDEVKNISSLILPTNIGVIKGHGKNISTFNGYEKKPLEFITPQGEIFKIYSKKATQSINSPIYYKNVKIGKIVKIDLSNDATKVVLYAFIEHKYLKLIRKNSKFYDISGIDFHFSLFSGAKIKTNTLTSILKGGILVITPIHYSNKATIKDSFELEENLPKNWQNISPKIHQSFLRNSVFK